MALAVPLSRFTSRVGGGSAFFVRQQSVAGDFPVGFRGGVFWWFAEEFWFELVAVGWLALKRSSRRFYATSSWLAVGLRFTGFIESWIFCCLTRRRSQRLLSLAVPLSRFTSQMRRGSAFFVRPHLAPPMITPQQFKQSWELQEHEHLVSFPQSSISDVQLPADARAFLVEVGLPEDAAPFLSFSPPKSGTLPRVSVVWHQPSEFDRYRMIGSNGSGDPVCLDEKAGGQVVYLNHDNLFQRVLMASSVITLAASLLQVRDFVAESGGFSAMMAAGSFEPLVARLRSIDPAVCGEGGYWRQEFRCFQV